MNPGHPSPSLLAKFRSDRRRLPLHPREKAVLTVVAVHLCFLPWAFGTMHTWSQVTSLGFSLLAFGLALIPRHYTAEQSGGPAMQLTMWPRLLHFPIFWIGLALLAYIAVQGFNPSWVYTQNDRQWWLIRVNDIPWLPTSIDTPFERFNLWRQFIIYASAWLTMCTVWTGFTRRRSLQLLLVTVVLNGIALGIAGLYLRATTTTDTVFWLWRRVPNTTAFASFYYRNHAGAYLDLLAVVALALAFWHYENGRRKLKKSTPASLYALGAGFFCLCVLFTYARGAAFVLIVAFLLIGTYLTWRFVRDRGWLNITPGMALTMVTLFGGVLALVMWQVDLNRMTHRVESFLEHGDQEASVHQRLLAYDSASAMLQDSGLRGVGAGGFSYLFPAYVQRHPEIYRNGRLFWEHAHNDWVEILIELGAAAGLFFVAALGWFLVFFRRHRLWTHPLSFILLLGCFQTMVHALIDFPFQNPAILLTWGVLLVLAFRWAELEAPE